MPGVYSRKRRYVPSGNSQRAGMRKRPRFGVLRRSYANSFVRRAAYARRSGGSARSARRPKARSTTRRRYRRGALRSRRYGGRRIAKLPGKVALRRAIYSAIAPEKSYQWAGYSRFKANPSDTNGVKCKWFLCGVASTGFNHFYGDIPPVSCYPAMMKYFAGVYDLEQRPDCIFYQTAFHLEHVITSTSQQKIRLEAYLFETREHLPSTARYTEPILTQLSQAWYNTSVIPDVPSASYGQDLTELTPYQGPGFLTDYKIVRTKKMSLSAGQIVRFRVDDNKMRTIRPMKFCEVAVTKANPTWADYFLTLRMMRGSQFWLFKIFSDEVAVGPSSVAINGFQPNLSGVTDVGAEVTIKTTYSYDIKEFEGAMANDVKRMTLPTEGVVAPRFVYDPQTPANSKYTDRIIDEDGDVVVEIPL